MKTSIIRRKLTPPKPTIENPHIQIDWIWKHFLRRYKSEKTKASIIARLAAYKRFLRETNGNDERLKNDPRFYLAVHWDHLAILNAEQFWRDCGYASTTVHSYIKGLKGVMDFAADVGLTPTSEFIYPQIKGERETKTREAYSDEEISIIRKLISEAVEQSNLAAKGYTLTGIGTDPRRFWNRSGEAFEHGWMCWENLVWYFENIMNCVPLIDPRAGKGGGKNVHRQFFLAARKYHGGIGRVWERLGVFLRIGSNLVIPLAMKLAWETGLNPESILNLKRDCYHEEHPLTGRPCIRYYKERSTGEKDLQLALFDTDNEADLQLFPKQSEIVRRTIELIQKLTKPLVEKALPVDMNYLLLFETSHGRTSRISKDGVMRVSKGAVQGWSQSVRTKLKKTTGDTLEILNLVRFRATRITQMVLEGHDFFRIQVVAGHSSVITTARYISTYQLEPKAQAEVAKTLVQIQRNAREFNENPKSYATSADRYDPQFVYKGVMSDCRNPFDPPKSVRGLKSYRKGDSCTYWNMCLLCPNVIITRKHLPILVGYANEVDISFKNQNLTQIPKNSHYRKVFAVLNEIFREFSDADMKWATGIAECGDVCADGITYRAVRGQ